MNEIKELELLTEQEINEIKNETKRRLNVLDDEINDILEKLDVDLTTLITKCRFFWKKLMNVDFFWKTLWIRFRWKGKRIKIISKKRNEIKRLKEEA